MARSYKCSIRLLVVLEDELRPETRSPHTVPRNLSVAAGADEDQQSCLFHLSLPRLRTARESFHSGSALVADSFTL